MGRYSSSESGDDRRSKKSKRYRSRSRSYSSVDSYSSKASRSKKKPKKSKKKHKKRSRSRSGERDYRKRRSYSRSRSRSRGRRSRSRSRTRRSRSRDRRSRSGSYSRSSYRSRRSRSRSPRRSRSPWRARSPRRSRSKSKSRSRKSSRTRSKYDRSRSPSKSTEVKPEKEQKPDPCAQVPGFFDMTPAEQNEFRMKLALKAAAETNARLREQGVLSGNSSTPSNLAPDEVVKRQKAIAEIDADSFTQQTFSSSRNAKNTKEDTQDDIHEAAMFGDVTALKLPKAIVYKDTDSILAPIFYEDEDKKWERWAQYVKEFRRRKLEGEAMT